MTDYSRPGKLKRRLGPTPSLRPAEPRPGVPGPSWFWSGRVPSLDGLRAVSIALVLFSHAALTHGFPGRGWLQTTFNRTRDVMGDSGVEIFFCISGFLITLLLLRELSRTGSLSLKEFYRRRALRILPVYVVFVLVVFALTRLSLVHLRGQDWLGVLTYTLNFYEHKAWPVGHIWSLSIEEQFYLVWPPLLLLLRPKRALYALLGFLMAIPALRVCIWQSLPQYPALAYTSLLTRADGIAAGCLLALLAADPTYGPRMQLTGRRALAAGLLAAGAWIASFTATSLSPLYTITVGRTLSAIAIAAVLWLCATHPTRGIGPALNCRLMVILGTLSYSLYIWQQLFLHEANASWVARWPVNLVLAILVAAASYVLVESPFLRLKDRKTHARSGAGDRQDRLCVADARASLPDVPEVAKTA